MESDKQLGLEQGRYPELYLSLAILTLSLINVFLGNGSVERIPCL